MKALPACGFFLCCWIILLTGALAQSSDDQYRRPLKAVLKEVETRYGVTIKADTALTRDRWVNYADWRFRPDVDTTLDNILKPLDLKVNQEKPRVYKLKNYEYYRWAPAEGWAELDRIAAQYHDRATWERRKDSLKSGILRALQLAPLPAAPASRPILTPVRRFKGYTVQNVAIEILPGVYINGSLYQPAVVTGKIPVILNPDGHWGGQRYRPDCQYRCAALARMGAMAFSYDLFAWGESLLQFKSEDHRRSLAQTIQALGAIRILDYLLSLKAADTGRVAITGGSGGGSHTVLMTAIDDRIRASAPVVSLSSYFYGGCPCESGMPVHQCAGGTDNVEMAAMAAPKPQLVVTDGKDWTDRMPEHDFPYLQKMYAYYGQAGKVANVHLPAEGHDFGISKRTAVYRFMASYLGLNLAAVQDAGGNIDESGITIEPEAALYVFGEKGERLPANAIHGFEQLEKVFATAARKCHSRF